MPTLQSGTPLSHNLARCPHTRSHISQSRASCNLGTVPAPLIVTFARYQQEIMSTKIAVLNTWRKTRAQNLSSIVDIESVC